MMRMAAGSKWFKAVICLMPFTTTRCLEQIRTGVAYHDAPVVIWELVLAYPMRNWSNSPFSEISQFFVLSLIYKFVSLDSQELEAQLRQAINEDCPTYIRIGKKGEPILHKQSSDLGIGKANFLRQGSDLLVIGVGPILSNALDAAEIAASFGISVAVASIGSVKPIDCLFLEHSLARYKKWISIEEHCINGGLGSALLEYLSANKINDIQLTRLGAPDSFIHELGDQQYVRKCLGLDSDALSKVICEVVGS